MGGEPLIVGLTVAEFEDISLTLCFTALIAYMVSIPLGIRKAVRDGSRFDTWTSGVLVAAYAIPGFLFAILLLVLFAGGSFVQWFPLRGLTSENWDQLGPLAKVADYFWHLALPVTASLIGAFTFILWARLGAMHENRVRAFSLIGLLLGIQLLFGALFGGAPDWIADLSGFAAGFALSFVTGPGGPAHLLKLIRQR